MAVRLKSCILLVAFLPILVYGDPLSAFREPRLRGAEILDFGIYEGVGDAQEGQIEGRDGFVINILSEFRLIKQTDRIPGKLGIHFGLRFRLLARISDENELVEIGKIWIIPNPGFKDPVSGAIRRFTSYKEREVVGRSSYVGWGFDREEEIVEGLWKVAVIDSDENILLEKDFYIYTPQ